jgi:hypothetical protein
VLTPSIRTVPRASVVSVRAKPMAGLAMVTCASGTGAPLSSATAIAIAACWASAAGAISTLAAAKAAPPTLVRSKPVIIPVPLVAYRRGDRRARSFGDALGLADRFCRNRLGGEG